MIDYGEEATRTVGAFIDLNPEAREQVEKEFAIDFTPWRVDVMPEGQQGKTLQIPVIDAQNTIWDKHPSNVTDVIEHYVLEFRNLWFYSGEFQLEINLQMDHCYVDGRTKVRSKLVDMHDMQTWEQSYPLWGKRNDLLHEIEMMFKANIFSHSNINMEAAYEDTFVFQWRGQFVNLLDYSIARLQQVREQITDETAKGWLRRLAQERYPDISYL